jgi:hypothetical protein
MPLPLNHPVAQGAIEENETPTSRRSSVARRVGRPNKAESFRPLVEELVARDPAAATRELLACARLAGYAGGKTAFYALVARARQRLEPDGLPAAPAERSHHDVGEADVSMASGARRRIRFFVSRLAYSGWIAASLIEDDSVEAVARALVAHFAAMGGVPLVARFERPKPLAESCNAQGAVEQWNMALAYLALELGVGVEVRRPRALARRVKEGVFHGQVFHDRADVAARLAAWCDEVDLHRPADALGPVGAGTAAGVAGATPATLLAHERRRLRPLAVAPEHLELREPIFVGAGGTVVHRGHAYLMPAAAAGRMGVLLLGRERVRILAGGVEVVHARPPQGPRAAAPA